MYLDDGPYYPYKCRATDGAFNDTSGNSLKKREYFAGLFLQSLIIAKNPIFEDQEKSLAVKSVKYADALIAALNGENPKEPKESKEANTVVEKQKIENIPHDIN